MIDIDKLVRDLTAVGYRAKSDVRRMLCEFAERVQLETATAYGGCRSCYGKGYSTTIEFTEGAGDFGGDGSPRHKLPIVRPCRHCDRGTQIKKLLEHKT